MDSKETISSKTGLYPTAVTTVVRSGSVAERISQLQAKLSSKKPDQSVSPIQRCPYSPTAHALSRYSMSNLLLSPRNIPLPETPEHQSFSSEGYDQGKRQTSRLRNVSRQEYVDGLKSSATGDPPEHAPASKLGVEEDPGSEVQEHNDRNRVVRDELINRERPRYLDSSFSRTPTKGGITMRHISQGLVSSSDRNISPGFTEYCHGRYRDSSRIHRHTKDSKTLQIHGSDANTPSQYNKKSSNTLPGSAYSKIRPYMLGPSIGSYIPRCKSREDHRSEETSPNYLRKRESTISEEINAPPAPRSSPSPRHRDIRSLRRRNFNTKSEESVKQHGEFMGDGNQDLQSGYSSTSFEDVFIESVYTPASLREALPLVATDRASPSPQSLHDIQNPSYMPSIMPRRLNPSQVRKNSYKSSSSALTARRHGSHNLSVLQSCHTHDDSHDAQDDCSGLVEGLDKNEVGLMPGMDGDLIPNNQQMSRAPSSSPSQKSSTEKLKNSEANEAMGRTQDQDLTTVILNRDGTAKWQHNQNSNAIGGQIFSVAILGNTHPSKSRIPQPVPVSGSKVRSSPVSPSRVENISKIQNDPQGQEQGLQVIITVQQNIRDVLKIELHPLPNVNIPHTNQKKENCIE